MRCVVSLTCTVRVVDQRDSVYEADHDDGEISTYKED